MGVREAVRHAALREAVAGRITNSEGMRRTGLKRSQFLRYKRRYRRRPSPDSRRREPTAAPDAGGEQIQGSRSSTCWCGLDGWTRFAVPFSPGPVRRQIGRRPQDAPQLHSAASPWRARSARAWQSPRLPPGPADPSSGRTPPVGRGRSPSPTAPASVPADGVSRQAESGSPPRFQAGPVGTRRRMAPLGGRSIRRASGRHRPRSPHR